jgi:hypothetical protein
MKPAQMHREFTYCAHTIIAGSSIRLTTRTFVRVISNPLMDVMTIIPTNRNETCWAQNSTFKLESEQKHHTYVRIRRQVAITKIQVRRCNISLTSMSNPSHLTAWGKRQDSGQMMSLRILKYTNKHYYHTHQQCPCLWWQDLHAGGHTMIQYVI